MHQSKPLITIITPSYNQGHFIERTITSVLSQRNASFEYIIMDGVSTDNTLDIIKKYQNRLRWISKKDNGQSDAIDQGITMAQGTVIGWINSDDYLLPNALATVQKTWEADRKTLWMTGDCLIVDKNNNEVHKLVQIYKSFLRRLPPAFYLKMTNAIAQPSTFFSKQAYYQIGGLNKTLHYAMDYDLWLRYLSIRPPVIINSPLSAFRIHSDAKGSKTFKAQFAEDYQVCQKYIKNAPLVLLHKIHNNFIINAYRFLKGKQTSKFF